jgi:hypothetical protein
MLSDGDRSATPFCPVRKAVYNSRLSNQKK